MENPLVFLGVLVIIPSIIALFLPKNPKNSTQHRLSILFFVIVNNFPMTVYVLWDMSGTGGHVKPSFGSLWPYYFVWNAIIFFMISSLRCYEKFSFWHIVSMILCAIAMALNITLVIYSRIP
jgi:uncharacterized membrane protein